MRLPPSRSGGYFGGVTVTPGYGVGYYGLPYYGFGYSQDPYRSGRFVAPDLHDDPFFRAQHKFDSHYPGRYPRRPPLQFRTR